MAERKLIERLEGNEKISFAESLRLIVNESQFNFSDQERVQFEREKYAEQEAKKQYFVLGRQVE